MKNSNNTQDIILASKSPRRHQLLKDAGFSFTVIPSRINERLVQRSTPENHVRILAESKAKDVAKDYPNNWVIGADTVVLIGDTILGKPKSKSHARDMLSQLSGNKHTVFTGFCICCKREKREITKTIHTEVFFKNLTIQEIEWYIRTKEPFDKAGGYAIQGIGAFMIKKIKGSYTNVMGLPLCEVVEHLTDVGVTIK